jgi:hypothetical protein
MEMREYHSGSQQWSIAELNDQIRAKQPPREMLESRIKGIASTTKQRIKHCNVG